MGIPIIWLFFVCKCSIGRPLDFFVWMRYNEVGDGTHNKKLQNTDVRNKGRTPMTKNIMVTDENGDLIGFTYPKRVKGLVKNGRAELVSDCKIRLTDRCPTETKNSEDISMNIINFNAREFKFDQRSDNNVGSRMFITDDFGNNSEIFEIGDWHWNWTQLLCEKRLKKNTDYVFRFAVSGGVCNTCDETLQFVIAPENIWEERYTYQLAKSSYKPIFSKKCKNGDMLRVYEIPFNTGECEDFAFSFIAMHAVARIMPVFELEKYTELEDYSYEQFREELKAWQNNNGENDRFNDVNINLSGAVISQKTLNKILSQLGDDVNVDLSGAVISED